MLEYTHAHACAGTLLLTLPANIHGTQTTRGVSSVLIPLVSQSDPVPWYLDPKKLSDICCSSAFQAAQCCFCLSRKPGKLAANVRILAGFMDLKI